MSLSFWSRYWSLERKMDLFSAYFIDIMATPNAHNVLLAAIGYK